jgi:hypothetical protein
MISASPTLRIAAVAGLIGLVLGTALGLGIGWKLYHHEQIIETAKPEQRLEDLNAVVLQRLPENVAQPISPEIKKAAKKVGGKLERAATVTVRPKPSEGAPAGCSCDDVTVDIGVVDQGDGKRIVTHTDDGTIIGGTDVPLEPYTVAKETKWEVGLVVPVENYEGTGGYVSRKVGPFSVGLQVAKPYADESYTAMATVGIRF